MQCTLTALDQSWTSTLPELYLRMRIIWNLSKEVLGRSKQVYFSEEKKAFSVIKCSLILSRCQRFDPWHTSNGVEQLSKVLSIFRPNVKSYLVTVLSINFGQLRELLGSGNFLGIWKSTENGIDKNQVPRTLAVWLFSKYSQIAFETYPKTKLSNLSERIQVLAIELGISIEPRSQEL